MSKNHEYEIRAVAVEITEYLNEEIVKKTGRVWEWGIVNVSIRTHICSLQPSWYFVPIGLFYESEPDDEGELEALDEVFDEIKAELEPNYYDSSILRAEFIDVSDKWDFDEEDEEDPLEPESLIDCLQGNPVDYELLLKIKEKEDERS